ncbi:D-glycero-beta-D-manno-heptose 1-phosphate adenylyltransferase [Curtobacterium sp. 'Ferrero']|uniref:D-glycero-beta-D-manno-heptose 1-phosphate adenylyltransferase n=1 Tax=Curtobacterium sp. 'Ferrero' TaxID=2033654 RepID=UPI000BCFD1AA|nr:D-glycero-beta-D-manno-heptose 1-phosphate adenylyltransferase [Curtobacterium sp. 'Ferrero']PCN47674.1 D-glycero-beta-D-manno-heptose 1-phosphate adenylyltransferase [Curtobacterium sp. 'Ferrero']
MTADARLVRDLVGRLDDQEPLVVVVGDCILDRWTVGEAERVSREAPAPIVRVTETIAVPGGAANTAVNARALGARVRMVGYVGDDEAGRTLRDRLAAAGVDTTFLVEVAGATTTTKDRVVGGDRVVVRVDAIADPPDAAARAQLGTALRRALRCADAAVVCDYGLGVDPETVVPVVDLDRPDAVLVDAHDLRRWAPLRPDLVTPNAGETARLLGADLGTGAARAVAAAGSRDELLRATGAGAVVVTLDRDGTVLLEGAGAGSSAGDGAGSSAGAAAGSSAVAAAGSSAGADAGDVWAPFRTRATPAAEQQASGAGDTFCAGATVALAVGSTLREAVAFAQAAADVVVREAGTSVCSARALVGSVTAPAETVVDHDELADAVDRARATGRRIVFTNGCFDVVHRGHTSYLRQASELGDLLVVALNDDDSVRRLKGPERPINTAEDRAGVLAALACVDLVTVFATDTPIPLLRRIRPDVYVKGGDYSPEMLAETAVVREYGGEVVMVDYVPEHSTTAVVRRIRESS